MSPELIWIRRLASRWPTLFDVDQSLVSVCSWCKKNNLIFHLVLDTSGVWVFFLEEDKHKDEFSFTLHVWHSSSREKRGCFRSFVHRPRLLTGWLHHNHRQCLAVSLFYRRRLRSLLLCSTDQTTAVCILTGWPCLRSVFPGCPGFFSPTRQLYFPQCLLFAAALDRVSL